MRSRSHASSAFLRASSVVPPPAPPAAHAQVLIRSCMRCYSACSSQQLRHASDSHTRSPCCVSRFRCILSNILPVTEAGAALACCALVMSRRICAQSNTFTALQFDPPFDDALFTIATQCKTCRNMILCHGKHRMSSCLLKEEARPSYVKKSPAITDDNLPIHGS